MDKTKYLKELKGLLDEFALVPWNSYLDIQERISFYRFRKNEVIRRRDRFEEDFLFLMQGLVGFNVQNKLNRVFPSSYLAMDLSSYHLNMPSKYEIVALEPSLLASISKDDIDLISEYLPQFERLSERVLAHKKDFDEFWDELEGQKHTEIIPMVQERFPSLKNRISKQRFSELAGIVVKTLNRYEEMGEGNKEIITSLLENGAQGFINKQLRRNPCIFQLKHSLQSWASFYPLIADLGTLKSFESIELPYLIGHLYPIGEFNRVYVVGKLITLMTAIDVFIYGIQDLERAFYWTKIREGIKLVLEGRSYNTTIPRLQAYFSAMDNVLEEFRQNLDEVEYQLITRIIDAYIHERTWKMDHPFVKDKKILKELHKKRMDFSEGRMAMELLRITMSETWKAVSVYHDSLRRYMERGIYLILISNEMLVTETKVFGSLAHNMVNIKASLDNKEIGVVREELLLEYNKEMEAMELERKDLLMINNSDKVLVLNFLKAIEAQVAGWREWYIEVLIRRKKLK